MFKIISKGAEFTRFQLKDDTTYYKNLGEVFTDETIIDSFINLKLNSEFLGRMQQWTEHETEGKGVMVGIYTESVQIAFITPDTNEADHLIGLLDMAEEMYENSFPEEVN